MTDEHRTKLAELIAAYWRGARSTDTLRALVSAAYELGVRQHKYAVGQHDLACEDLGVGKTPDDPGATLHEAVQDLKLERDALRTALSDAHGFIQEVGTEDPDDVETMASIEALSGRITSALNYQRWLAPEPSK